MSDSKVNKPTRRVMLSLQTSSEIAIRKAILEVENLSYNDERLTNAIKLLNEANQLVSDVVDDFIKNDTI